MSFIKYFLVGLSFIAGLVLLGSILFLVINGPEWIKTTLGVIITIAIIVGLVALLGFGLIWLWENWEELLP